MQPERRQGAPRKDPHGPRVARAPPAHLHLGAQLQTRGRRERGSPPGGQADAAQRAGLERRVPVTGRQLGAPLVDHRPAHRGGAALGTEVGGQQVYPHGPVRSHAPALEARGPVAAGVPPAPPIERAQHDQIVVEGAEVLRIELEDAVVVPHAGRADGGVALTGDDVPRGAGTRPRRLDGGLAVQQRLAPAHLRQLLLALPQARLAHAPDEMDGVVLPARALRVEDRVFAHPPRLAAEVLERPALVAERVGVRVLSEEEGLRLAPAWIEVVQQGLELGQLGVEVVIAELGELVEQAPVGFARAAVVAHERVAHQLLDVPEERLEQLGARLAVELAPEGVEHHARVVSHLAHDALVLDRRLAQEEGGGLGQPHGELEPHEHAELVAQHRGSTRAAPTGTASRR